MELSDPRASAFNKAEVVDALTFAMNMGVPQNPAERIVFKWNVIKQYAGPTDHAGIPLNLDEQPINVSQHPDVVVPLAMEFLAGSSGVHGTAAGTIDNPYMVLNILDTEYPKIATANYVQVGDEYYGITYMEPTVGLFGMTLYRIHIQARSET